MLTDLVDCVCLAIFGLLLARLVWAAGRVCPGDLAVQIESQGTHDYELDGASGARVG